MQGICTVCQSPQNVHQSQVPMQQMVELGEEEEDMLFLFGDPILYLVDSHDCCGEHCEGSGLVPQTILR